MANLIEHKRIIEQAGNLLTLPDICLQLRRIVNDPDSSVSDMAGLIAKDPALTARLLKLVNSSLYYLPRRISSVSEAITLVGSTQLYNLALATSAASIIQTVGGSYIELKTLWERAVYSAVINQTVFSDVRQNKESLFIAGLLANIGALAVIKAAPEIAMTAIGPANRGQYPWQREKEVLGFTIAEVSGALLDAWRLPEEIVVPVRYQHEPEKEQQYSSQCCALHVAVRLAYEMVANPIKESAQLDFKASVKQEALSVLAMVPDDLEVLKSEINKTAPEMLSILTLTN